jgi:hypothetical protein
MTTIHVLILVLAVSMLATLTALGFSLAWGLRERRRRKGRPLLDRSPVREVALAEIDPVFTAGPLGYGLETEVALIGDTGTTATTSDTEAWILCVLARSARRIFEFGTCSGRTAYLLARNAPHDAEIITLTLSPDTVGSYQAADEDPDSERWALIAAGESGHTCFLYEGTPEAARIRQLFGDSKAFDESPYAGQCDLIFIDGSHAESYVRSDSEKAFRMARKGGLIVWHDFSPACPGVWRFLNTLGESHPLMQAKGTRLVFARV